MKSTIRKGFGFGVTSGVITTLGMMVGLAFSTNSSIYVIAGIAVIAITDALSDAIAIHIGEEAGNQESEKGVWIETLATFFSKFFIALIFIVPVLIFSLLNAVIFSTVFGLALIVIVSVVLARIEKRSAALIIFENLLIAIVVIIATGLLGHYIETIKHNYL